MTLQTVLNDRNKWQNNTVNAILNKMNNRPMDFVPTGKEEKLCVLFGEPQVGKTTLILYLLGISAECYRHVYDVLRADIKRGNSSTSTAIIYQVTEKEEFGLAFGSNNAIETGDLEVLFYSEDEFKQHLKIIREDVENERGKSSILYIYIPQKYFQKNLEDYSNIHILDMPGYGSRNLKEKAHVDMLMARYLSLSSVNIIVCKGNEIQSLENIELPTGTNWRSLPHRYIVVITHAYGMENIRGYFVKSGAEHECSFEDFVKKEYEKGLRKILGEASEIEYFPIEIGDSLEQLLSGLSLEDKKEVDKVSSMNAECIRSAIQRRSGNELRSIIMDLQRYSSEFVQRELRELTGSLDEIDEELEDLHSCLDGKEKKIEECVNLMDSLRESHERHIRTVDLRFNKDYSDYQEVVLDKIHEISYGSTGKLRVSSSELVIDALKEQLEKYCADGIQFIRIIDEKNTANVSSLYSEIIKEIPLDEIKSFLRPGGIFRRKPRESDCIEIIESYFASFSSKLQEYLESSLGDKRKQLVADDENYKLYFHLKKQCEINCVKCKKEINCLENRRIDCIQKKQELEYSLEEDKYILQNYLAIARSQFDIQVNEIKAKIANPLTQISERIYLLILWGLLQEDYESVIGIASVNTGK